MATILTGDVEVVRVDELLDVSAGNIRDKKLLTDLITDGSSGKVAVPALEGELIHNNISEKKTAAIGETYGHVDNKLPLVFPTLTTIERDAISSPNTSMKIYNATTVQFELWDGIAWIPDNSAFSLANGSGTTANGSAVDLGGTLSGDATITASGNDFSISGTNDIIFGAAGSSPFPYTADIKAGATWLAMKLEVGVTLAFATSSELELGGGYAILKGEHSGNEASLNLNDVNLLVTDTFNNKGLLYAADYSSNFTDRSIVDEEYVRKPNLKSGTTQGGAGAVAGEIWVDTSDSHTLKMGV